MLLFCWLILVLDCGPPNIPEHAEIVNYDGTVYGSLFIYKCKPGYHVPSSGNITQTIRCGGETLNTCEASWYIENCVYRGMCKT